MDMWKNFLPREKMVLYDIEESPTTSDIASGEVISGIDATEVHEEMQMFHRWKTEIPEDEAKQKSEQELLRLYVLQRSFEVFPQQQDTERMTQGKSFPKWEAVLAEAERKAKMSEDERQKAEQAEAESREKTICWLYVALSGQEVAGGNIQIKADEMEAMTTAFGNIFGANEMDNFRMSFQDNSSAAETFKNMIRECLDAAASDIHEQSQTFSRWKAELPEAEANLKISLSLSRFFKLKRMFTTYEEKANLKCSERESPVEIRTEQIVDDIPVEPCPTDTSTSIKENKEKALLLKYWLQWKSALDKAQQVNEKLLDGKVESSDSVDEDARSETKDVPPCTSTSSAAESSPKPPDTNRRRNALQGDDEPLVQLTGLRSIFYNIIKGCFHGLTEEQRKQITEDIYSNDLKLKMADTCEDLVMLVMETISNIVSRGMTGWNQEFGPGSSQNLVLTKDCVQQGFKSCLREMLESDATVNSSPELTKAFEKIVTDVVSSILSDTKQDSQAPIAHSASCSTSPCRSCKNMLYLNATKAMLQELETVNAKNEAGERQVVSLIEVNAKNSKWNWLKSFFHKSSRVKPSTSLSNQKRSTSLPAIHCIGKSQETSSQSPRPSFLRKFKNFCSMRFNKQ